MLTIGVIIHMNLKLCVDLNKIEEIYQPGIFSTSILYRAPAERS